MNTFMFRPAHICTYRVGQKKTTRYVCGYKFPSPRSICLKFCEVTDKYILQIVSNFGENRCTQSQDIATFSPIFRIKHNHHANDYVAFMLQHLIFGVSNSVWTTYQLLKAWQCRLKQSRRHDASINQLLSTFEENHYRRLEELASDFNRKCYWKK